MRVVILTHNNERHFYFANRIIEEAGNVVGVITGGKYRDRKTRNPKKRSTFGDKSAIFCRFKNRFYNLRYKKFGRLLTAEKKEAEERFFGGSRERFERLHKQLHVVEVGSPQGSINDAYYVNIISALKPDIVVVMGTALISRKIIKLAPLALNLHTGLSPYYRGGYTNLWPIIDDAFGFFGVTIHLLSEGIDAGEIVSTDVPSVRPDSTYSDINCQCIVIGTTMMIEALNQASRGQLKSVPQWTSGKLFLNQDMNSYIAYQYFRKRAKFFQAYCNLQEKNQLPQPRLVRADV